MTSYCYFCGEPCNGPDGEVICPSCYLDIDDKEAWEDCAQMFQGGELDSKFEYFYQIRANMAVDYHCRNCKKEKTIYIVKKGKEITWLCWECKEKEEKKKAPVSSKR